jgi:hypothetical protein
MADGTAEIDSNNEELTNVINDPDAYKEDWHDALVFKKAMK